VELGDFVRETLVEILEGVKAANVEAKKHVPGEKNVYVLTGTGFKESGFVEFDVAVTSASTETTGAGGGIKLHVLSANVGGENRASAERVSRIRFKVGIQASISP
jgi:hypothetical protein